MYAADSERNNCLAPWLCLVLQIADEGRRSMTRQLLSTQNKRSPFVQLMSDNFLVMRSDRTQLFNYVFALLMTE